MNMDMEDPWRKKIVKKAAQVWVDQTYSYGGGEDNSYSKPSKPTPKGKEIQIMDLRDKDEEDPPPEEQREDAEEELPPEDDFLEDIFAPKLAPVKKKPKPEVKQEKSDYVNFRSMSVISIVVCVRIWMVLKHN